MAWTVRRDDGAGGGASGEPRWRRPAAPGWYDAVVVAEDDRPAKSGAGMLTATVVIGEGDPDRCPEGPVKVDLCMVLSGYWQSRLRGYLAAVDLPRAAALEAGGEVDLDVDQGRVGRALRVRVVAEEWDGKPSPKVEECAPAGAPVVPAAASRPATTTQEALGVGDDDLPF